MPPPTNSSLDATNALLGRGKIMMDRWVLTNGVIAPSTKWFCLGNCDDFSVGAEQDEIELPDFTSAGGQTFASSPNNTKVTGQISGFELSNDNLALSVLGDITTLAAQVGGAGLTANVLAADVKKGAFIKLPHREVTVTAVAQGGALTEGIDYEVTDARAGYVRLVPSGTYTEGTAVTITYTAGAIAANSQTVIRAGKTGTILGSLHFLPDPKYGRAVEAQYWRVLLKPNTPLKLIGSEWAKIGWTVTVQSDKVRHPLDEYGILLPR
jgi:hypothetical protein